MTKTVENLCADAVLMLNDSDTAKLDVHLLMMKVLDCDRAYLLAHPEHQLSQAQSTAFHVLVKQRSLGTPVAYLLGTQGFYDIQLQVNQHTLIPRPETELLVDWLLEHSSPDSTARVLDLGTGTGAIALTLAKHRPNWLVAAVDSSIDALTVARENAKNLDLDVAFIHSDWFQAIPERPFDYIVANPPYIAEHDPHLMQGDVRFEPKTALVADDFGLADIKTIVRNASHYLKPNAYLLIEHGFEQGDAVARLFKQYKYQNIVGQQDFAGHTRFTLGQWHG